MRQLRLSLPLIGGPSLIIEDGHIVEVRLTLPIIGGATAIYTSKELSAKFRSWFHMKPKPELPLTPSPYVWDAERRCYLPRK